MRRLVACILGAASLAAASDRAGAEPRPAHLRPELRTDEGGLWSAMDRAETEAKASADLDPDPAINAYVRGLVRKLAPDYSDDLRVYVMDRPFFNADMAPNGWAEVWSGLLLRVESEDQLAFVLGHEVTHFAENHSIKAWRSLKSRANTAAVFTVILAGGANVGAAAAGGSYGYYQASTLGGAIYLVALSGYFSFAREEEAQADELGLKRAIAAGYAPTAGAQVWRNLNAEIASSDFPKVRAKEASAGIFDTHPLTADRIGALDALAANAPGGRAAEDRKAYRAVIRPHLVAWLKDDLRRRDFGESLALIDRLSTEGEDLGALQYCRAEAFRLRRGDGDMVRARDAYAKAVSYDDAPVDAWRALGDAAAQTSDRATASRAYQAYLERAPNAQDRWIIEASLKKLEGVGS